MQAFVYMWQDIGVEPNKFYIGRKIGDYFKIDSANSYQTSSKLVAVEMKHRPNDFRRFLIDCGSKEEMVLVETELLKSVDAAKNPLYYNQHNGDGKFVTPKHLSEETKRKMSVVAKGKPKPWLKGISWHHSIEAKEKMRLSKLGNKNPMKRLEVRIKNSESQKGRICSEETKKKLREVRKKRLSSGALGKHWRWKKKI